ncbi:MAG: C10 family peptidase [Prevotella sp.]|nr:C10 family peptidase [Prevotella sp.]
MSNARAALRGAPSGEVGSEDKAYYLFDNGGDNGFVIVSGDDRLPEVIGYATHGMLSEDNMPVQLKSLLDAFEKQYATIADDDAKMQIAIAERKALTEASLAANISVSPLLGEIAWGQGTPFNDLCPQIGDTHAVTGCVATAMGQLIRYHQYPSQLQADIPGYTTKSSITLPAISTSEAVYDYEKMLPYYTSGSYTEEQGESVAKLLYHCGCSVEMDYGVSGSGAVTKSAAAALGKYFGYDSSTLAFISREDYTLAQWCEILDHELTNSRPVLYDGSSATQGGHAFICDGADGSGFYHINWGWNGGANGYFDISLLNSSEANTTSGEDGFNGGMGMLIGIKPSTSLEGAAPLASWKNLCAAVNSVSLTSATRENTTGTFGGTVKMRLSNLSFTAFSGWVALAVKNQESGFTMISSKSYLNLWASLISGTYYITDPNISFNYAFPIGTTKVYVVYGSGDNANICGYNEGKPYFYINATETNASHSAYGYALSATLTAENTLYNGIDNVFKLNVSNSGEEEYLANVKVYYSNTSEKPASATSTALLTVPSGGSTERTLTINPAESGKLYVWVDDVYDKPLVTAQEFNVETSSKPVLTLISVESNAMADRYEMQNAIVVSGENQYQVKAPKTYDDAATFTFKVKNTGGATTCRWVMQCSALDGASSTAIQKAESRYIDSGATEAFTITATPEQVGSRFITGIIFVETSTPNNFTTPDCSNDLPNLVLPIMGGQAIALQKYMSAVYVAKTTPLETHPDNNSNYWATYSNRSSDVEFGVPSDKSFTLYNVTVSNGKMTLTPREGEYAYKVAAGEAVLVKSDANSVKIDDIGTGNGLESQSPNELTATPADEQIKKAEEGKVFYRLTYDNVETQKDLGFYLGVATVDGKLYNDGSYLKATPGKGYLYVSKSAATATIGTSQARCFILGDDDPTGIEGVTLSESKLDNHNADTRLFNLQGQQVKTPTKGLYIKSNKKVLIK